jgi:hypothetical protein
MHANKLRIISQVLHWDKRELRKRAEKIDKDKDAPPKEVRDELKDWIRRAREEHEECRRQSKEQDMSIVAVIMAMSPHSVDLSDTQHAKALEYLSLHLAVRDRQEIVRVLCHGNPDHLTTAVRHAVDAYTPMIRNIHQAANLSDSLWDLERFITDMLKISKPSGPKGEEKPPSVEDYVDLCHRHQGSLHKFLHQVAKNGKEVTSWWKDYVHMAAAHFKRDAKPPPSDTVVPESVTAGGALKKLDSAFASLPSEDKEAIKKELDAYSKYLHDLHEASAKRISAVIKRTHKTPYGPGAYLARWQHLLDTTMITPDKVKGPVRYGSNKTVKELGRKDVDGSAAAAAVVAEDGNENGSGGSSGDKLPEVPHMERTLGCLGPKFRGILMGE